jgi:hypothetical protein
MYTTGVLGRVFALDADPAAFCGNINACCGHHPSHAAR